MRLLMQDRWAIEVKILTINVIFSASIHVRKSSLYLFTYNDNIDDRGVQKKYEKKTKINTKKTESPRYTYLCEHIHECMRMNFSFEFGFEAFPFYSIALFRSGKDKRLRGFFSASAFPFALVAGEAFLFVLVIVSLWANTPHIYLRSRSIQIMKFYKSDRIRGPFMYKRRIGSKLSSELVKNWQIFYWHNIFSIHIKLMI